MKVLYDHQIFSSQPSGGISRYFVELLKGMKPPFEPVTGWRYTANRYLQEWKPEQFQDWLPQRFFKGKAHITGLLNRTVSLKALRTGSWDVFHPTYYDPYFLSSLQGRPFVLTIHDMTHELHPEGLSDRLTVPGRKRLLAQAATRVVAVSENTKRDAIRLLDLDPAKVITIPHGNSLRPELVQASPPQISSPYWLYVGARAAYKNWELILHGLAKRPTSEILVSVGASFTWDERRLISRLSLQDRVVSTRATDSELAGLYTRSLGLVYPSRYEGFGLPLVEAMAWGCPVLAANASCLPEVGGSAALYFDPESPSSLVEAMESLDQPGERAARITEGLKRAQLFTWERTIEQTAAVYRAAKEHS